MKILTIFGTRPEAIKMAPIIKAFSNSNHFEVKICVTGQHRKMLDQVLSLYDITPTYDLNIMNSHQTLTQVTSQTLNGLEKILEQDPPDWIFVQGDTGTTFAASLAAYYKKIPVAHIEAGLRTQEIYSPWPEEINRQLTTRIAKLHFAPTETAKNNLLMENIPEKNIKITGNTGIDALLDVANYIERHPTIKQELAQKFSFLDPSKKLILITCHRRENFGEGIKGVCQALLHLAEYPNLQIVYPVHLNPNIQDPVHQMLSNKQNIYLIEPQTYLHFVYLMNRSYLILTDSGGIQEEAPSLGKPVLVTRDTTERPEAVLAGTAILVGTNKQNIIRHIENLLDNTLLYERMSNSINPYGNGDAAIKIKECIQYGNVHQ